MEENKYSKYDGLSLAELAREMLRVKKEKERIDAASKEINKEYDFLRITKLPEQAETEGTRGAKYSGIGRLSFTSDMYVSVKAGCLPTVSRWLQDTGRGDLIIETVNSSSLKAVVKQAMVGGEEVPTDALNVSPFTRASITEA
jgi:hypothetical protein